MLSKKSKKKGEAINRLTLGQKLLAYTKKPFSFMLLIAISISAIITLGSVVWIIVYIFMKGTVPLFAQAKDLFALTWTTTNQSMLPALINTLQIIVVSLLIAVPIGVCAAVYLVEYANSKSMFVQSVRLAAEVLAGIPSIVYGIFGMIVFVNVFQWGYSILGGALTMSFMILPLILRTTEESLRAVPNAIRESSYALGAGKLRTIFHIILPAGLSGILSGIIMGIGRVVGETGALIYTAGITNGLGNIFNGDGGKTLSVHLYFLAKEGLYTDKAWATALVLLLLVFAVYGLAGFVENKLKREY